LRVSVTDAAGRPVRDGGLARWLASIPARDRRPRSAQTLRRRSGAAAEVAIALLPDARVRALNRRYRGKDKATDVLSFAAEASGPSTVDGFLGDIVIATGTARRQARDAKHSYQTELRVLALHGLLHLLGYDHESPGDRGRMARAEARLRRRGGLSAGLIERS
jgi:probable rRNA maturation factor